MKYYCDGFMIKSNPSPYGGGYTIVDENNVLIKREVVKQSGFTCNEAELLGILETLRLAEYNDKISTDSMCTLTWVNAGKSKARPDLNDKMLEAKNLKREKNINLMWEDRNYNLAGKYNEENPTNS